MREKRGRSCFFFLFFTDGPAGAKKYLDIGREGKLSIYSFAQILTRSKSRLILAEERAGRSCTVKAEADSVESRGSNLSHRIARSNDGKNYGDVDGAPGGGAGRPCSVQVWATTNSLSLKT